MAQAPKSECLKGITYYQFNEEQVSNREPHTGVLIEPITVNVPPGTTSVHVAFRSVHMFFGTPSAPATYPLQSIGFEIVDGKMLPGDKYRFELRAVLATEHVVDWTPYFVLEILCPGYPLPSGHHYLWCDKLPRVPS